MRRFRYIYILPRLLALGLAGWLAGCVDCVGRSRFVAPGIYPSSCTSGDGKLKRQEIILQLLVSIGTPLVIHAPTRM